MTPKEKAEELFRKYLRGVYINKCPNDIKETLNKIYERPEITFVETEEYSNTKPTAKVYALIAVDEILNVLPQQEYLEDRGEYSENRERIYWKEVKQEIDKL